MSGTISRFGRTSFAAIVLLAGGVSCASADSNRTSRADADQPVPVVYINAGQGRYILPDYRAIESQQPYALRGNTQRSADDNWPQQGRQMYVGQGTVYLPAAR